MIQVNWLEPFEFFEKAFVEDWLFADLYPASSTRKQGITEVECLAGNLRRMSDSALKGLSRRDNSARLILSDEQLLHRYAQHRKARRIFRNYFQPQWSSARVFTLPLGFNPGFVPISGHKFSSYQREHAWSFVGEIKDQRQSVIDSFSKFAAGYVFAGNSFNDPQGLGAKALFEVYQKSHFVLCPFGNKSPDSFRVMEALEAGAIPVTVEFLKSDHNRLIFGDHPFIVGKDWSDAAHRVESLLRSPQDLEELHQAVARWYDGYRARLKRDLMVLMSGGRRSALVSEQFVYQRRACFSPLVRWNYLNHYSPALRELRGSLRRLRDSTYLRIRRLLRCTSRPVSR